MVIVPSRFSASFLLGKDYPHKNLDWLMRRIEDHMKTKGENKNLCGLVLQICHSSLSRRYESDNARDLYLGPVAVHAALMRDASLFNKAVRLTARGFEKDYYCALGELICLQDLVVQENE